MDEYNVKYETFHVRLQTSKQYNTIQYNTIQYNTIQYNTIQYNTIQYIVLHSGSFAYSKLQTSIYNFQNVIPLRKAKIK